MDRHVVADPSHSLLRLAVCGAVAVADRGGGLSPATGGQHAVAVHLAARVLCVRGVDGGGDRRPLLRGAPGQEMPFAAQFVGPSGFGPPDVLGSRQRLYDRGTDIPSALTIAAAVGAIAVSYTSDAADDLTRVDL